MFSCKMISILGVIFACLISSTSCNSSEEKETHMATLVEEMKKFLQEIKKLDSELQLPSSLNKLDKVDKKYYIFFSVKNKKSRFKRFKKAYKEFVEYSEECLSDYIKQFDYINQWHGVGNQSTRTELLEYYDDKFSKKMKLKGYFDDEGELENLYKDLEKALENFYNKVKSLTDRPLYVIPEEHYSNGKHHTDHSSSESGEEILVPLVAAGVGAGVGVIVGEELGKEAAEDKKEEKHKSSSSSASSAAEGYQASPAYEEGGIFEDGGFDI